MQSAILMFVARFASKGPRNVSSSLYTPYLFNLERHSLGGSNSIMAQLAQNTLYEGANKCTTNWNLHLTYIVHKSYGTEIGKDERKNRFNTILLR